ncbi:hypothetical protein [Pseudomonas sp. TCU-HL1]|uniref:hypothetical protein n=1 Tax=Pseudomonas sp. TCU-HL1 TaxID=1856685 RepID=UPI00083D2BD8|nr:hypothetical protein [Pseudomonas sp. TCU-HL1]
MFAAPAVEVLKRHTNLLVMPLFAAAWYASFGVPFLEFISPKGYWFYWPAFALLFVLQVFVISGVVQAVDLLSIHLSVYIQSLRFWMGLVSLTIGFIPLTGLAKGEVHNLLWPVAMLIFGFHMFNDDYRLLGRR